MELIIENFGCFLSKKSERILVKQNGKVEAEYPLYDLEQVTLASRGISLSTDLIEECADRGIQINFLTSAGQPYAKLTSPALSATVATRREQIMAYTDARGRDFAKQVVLAKTKNQINLLKYMSKYRKQTDVEKFAYLHESIGEMEAIRFSVAGVEGDTVDEVRGQLLSIEGRVSERYWSVIGTMLPDDVPFEGRERRGANDVVNCILNYGYGILYSRVWGAVILAGLEPFAGFLHVDRPGKPSLILDLVEEFRQPVVDKAVWGWLNRGGRPELTEERLTAATRKEVLARIMHRLEMPELYYGKKQLVRNIIQEQCRRLASFLRGSRSYEGFTCTW